jgi:hypothetical protein
MEGRNLEVGDWEKRLLQKLEMAGKPMNGKSQQEEEAQDNLKDCTKLGENSYVFFLLL